MPLVNADTGQLATIAFATSAFSATYRQIGETMQERQALDVNGIADTGADKTIPGDGHTAGQIELEFYWDAKAAPPSIAAVPETITLTLPKSVPASAAAATVIGTGFVLRRSLNPQLARNGVNMGKMTVQFDGATGPAYTVEL